MTMSGEQFLRQAGYGFIHDHRSGHDSYVRRLGSGHYPRLHMYVQNEGDNIIFNLHFDQKQASYEGSHMHNAEYDGEIVAGEIDRLKSLLSIAPSSGKPAANQSGVVFRPASIIDPETAIGHGNLASAPKTPIKKSWWRKLFG